MLLATMRKIKIFAKIKKMHEIPIGLCTLSSFSPFLGFEGSSVFIHFTCNAIKVRIFLGMDVYTQFKLCITSY